jgi:cellulose synthase (UDP-forming)
MKHAQMQSQEEIRAQKKKAWKKFGMAIVTLLGVMFLTIYFTFRLSYINTSPALIVFSIILFVAELHSMLHLYGAFYSMWPRPYQEWPELNRSKDLRFNMFICVCGEPAEIVRETIKGALGTRQHYIDVIQPHHPPQVYVINDGKVARKDNWQEIESMCAEMGVNHIARDIPGHFKAGNINNALKATPTPDPHNTLDVIFDSDFAALPEFLVEICKPFVDDKIDFVQSPQRYKNETTWVAKASAAHQIFFFDHICPAKGWDNALFLCGTNFAIRRSALDAVDGIDGNFITEDYATSLNLHLEGRKGVFMPRVLALGAAPTSLKQYFTQQRRWAKGNFDVTGHYFKRLLFGPLTLKQKMHYLLSATYYLIGLRDFILMMAPLPYLFFGVSLIKPNNPWFLVGIYAPMMIGNFILYLKMFRYPVKSLVLDVVSFPTFTSAFFQSLFKQRLGFVVTIKKYEKEKPWAVYKPQLIVAFLLCVGLIYSLGFSRKTGYGAVVNYFWAIFDATFLLLGFYLIVAENASWGVWETVQKKRGARKEKAVVDGAVSIPSGIAGKVVERVASRTKGLPSGAPGVPTMKVHPRFSLPTLSNPFSRSMRLRRRAFRQWN